MALVYLPRMPSRRASGIAQSWRSAGPRLHHSRFANACNPWSGRSRLAVLVRLSYLSTQIVRAILVGQQPVELTPTRLVALSRNLPHDWQEQRQLLGFAPA